MYLAEDRNPRFFYGYIVVLGAFGVMLAAHGLFHSFGIFFEPLLTEFGWTRVATSGAYSLSMILIGLLTIGMGGLNDRFGPRILLTGSSFFFGLGYLLMSQIGTIWQLYLVYGLVIAIGMSATFAPLLSTVTRWFVRRRGLMTGIAFAGSGLGTIIMPLLASRLISIYGWRTSYIIVAVIVLVLVVLAAQFLKRDPGQMGLSPYGENEVRKESLDLQAREFSLQEAIHSRQLWLLCAMGFCFFFGVSIIMVHVVIHATGLGISALSAANILAVIGGANIAGRVIMGGVGDRIGNKLALIICFILMLIALVWLITIKEVWMFYLFAAVFGFGYGGIGPLRSPMVAELFGLSSHGAILGVVFSSDTLGGVIGPVLAGWIFDVTGSYQWAFLLSGVLSATGLILSSQLRLADRAVEVQSI